MKHAPDMYDDVRELLFVAQAAFLTITVVAVLQTFERLEEARYFAAVISGAAAVVFAYMWWSLGRRRSLYYSKSGRQRRGERP